MRNRANTPPKDESAFINGGTADLGTHQKQRSEPKSKAKPVSISFAEKDLESINKCIRDEMIHTGRRVNRSDVVRAAIIAFETLSNSERTELIESAKMQ